MPGSSCGWVVLLLVLVFVLALVFVLVVVETIGGGFSGLWCLRKWLKRYRRVRVMAVVVAVLVVVALMAAAGGDNRTFSGMKYGSVEDIFQCM